MDRHRSAETEAILLPCQEAALANIRRQAKNLESDAKDAIAQIARMSNIEYFRLEQAEKEVRSRARIALHFHPDRPVRDGTVASALLEDGLYRNQFETGISNGLVAAFRGGARDKWENSLFNDAYSDHRVSLAHRPKYGALDLTNSMDGPAPRFGSCYFLLKPAVSNRSTFTFGGSQDAPKCRGTLDQFASILQALLEESFTRDFMLGISGIRPPQVIDRLRNLNEAARTSTHSASPSRNLDHIIEAQIHGDIRLARDVDILVVDGGFKSTGIGRSLEEVGRKYKFAVRYYQGFQLDVRFVPLDFRGPSMQSLAMRISLNGIVDTAAIGRAVQDLTRNPPAWADRGTYSEVLQELKLLWHVLVRYG